MTGLANEIDNSFDAFHSNVASSLKHAQLTSSGQLELFKKSYRRLTSLQAWRSELLGELIDEHAMGFFREAQNDGVMSHIQAFDGRYRQSLQCLRSLIENFYRVLYYKDHPIELELWRSSDHRIDRTELENYLKLLPRAGSSPLLADGIALLSSQYRTLNLAVHASAEGFRMSKAGNILTSEFSLPDLRKWAANERDVITGVNLILIAIYREAIQGAALPNLRKTIAFSLSSRIRQKVKDKESVRIPTT